MSDDFTERSNRGETSEFGYLEPLDRSRRATPTYGQWLTITKRRHYWWRKIAWNWRNR